MTDETLHDDQGSGTETAGDVSRGGAEQPPLKSKSAVSVDSQGPESGGPGAHNRGRVFGKPFKKGEVANPAGRLDAPRLARKNAYRAVRVMVDILRSEKSKPADRITCAVHILRMTGQYRDSAVPVTKRQEEQLRDPVDNMTPAELVALVRSGGRRRVDRDKDGTRTSSDAPRSDSE